MTEKRRIEATAKLPCLAGKPGIEFVVQCKHRVVTSVQESQGGNHLPVGSPHELAARGSNIRKEFRDGRPEDQGIAGQPGSVVRCGQTFKCPLNRQINDGHQIVGRGSSAIEPGAPRVQGPVIRNGDSRSTTCP